MSHEALPIDIPAFARALEDLPVDALHTKAEELLNSIEHLKYSNNEMMPFADEGDQGNHIHPFLNTPSLTATSDCKDAMFEYVPRYQLVGIHSITLPQEPHRHWPYE